MLTLDRIIKNHFTKNAENNSTHNNHTTKGKQNGDISKGKRGKKRGRSKTFARNRFNFPRYNPLVDIVSEGEWLKGNS